MTPLRLLLGAYFKEIRSTGRGQVPADRGGILVAWHPNALIDPALMLAESPRPVVFGARHGLFSVPLLGRLLRALGTVPIYRADDAAGLDDHARREANRKSLDALAQRVGAGALSALFPEGRSHDEPHPVELKTGAARLYYRARQLRPAGTPPPAVLPVGLHYDRKSFFRSNALVWFHAPLTLPPDLDVDPPLDEDPDVARRRNRRWTELLDATLREVSHATEDWATHRLMHRARKLVHAERARRVGEDPVKPGIEAKTVGFARIRAGYYHPRDRDPSRAAAVRRRIEGYDAELLALGLQDHELDLAPRLVPTWWPFLLLAQLVLVLLLLPPVLLVGLAVNGPAALVVALLARWTAALEKDVASLRLMYGALVFPAAWVAAGVGGALASHELHRAFPALPGHPVLTGVATVSCAVLGGLVWLGNTKAVRRSLHAVRARLTRALRTRALARLCTERAEIYDAMLGLAEGVELPVASADGEQVMLSPKEEPAAGDRRTREDTLAGRIDRV